jgi:hypothetical protein
MSNTRWACVVAAVAMMCMPVLTAQSNDSAPQATQSAYPDSAEGLRIQFADVVRIARSRDQPAFHAALDSLAIPNSDKWFAGHFDPRFASQLPRDYSAALAKYQSHITWVMENFAKFDDFSITVQPSETPSPLLDAGFESLLPRPDDGIRIENYRLSSAASNAKHGPPSWVSSFVYIEGRFRFVGGTYPFWTEGLSAFRGPMSIPPAVVNGRTIQGIAYRHDQPGAGIDAIVQLKIDVGRDGRVRHAKVLSGETSFVKDAQDCLSKADFGALPDVPQLANAKREWDMEVAIFTPKK